nr:hypothetical protein [Lachnospiraceae bacterium]
MARIKWTEITSEDVIEAIKIFNNSNIDFPEAKSTFLVYNEKKYPAKHIRGMAYKVHFGEEISKADFQGGQETVRFFEKLGFKIEYNHKNVDTHPVKTSKKTIIEKKQDNPKVIEDEINNLSKTKNVEKYEKISIPVKGVIEQKNSLQLLLNKICEGDIVCEKTYSWMKTPADITGVYEKLYQGLSSYRGNKNFAKKNITLRCDFVCESKKLIIEYDERQHFSEARRVSLISYSDIELNYDKELWIKACKDVQAKDNYPKDRDEVRAYYDSIRDIEAAKHGYTLIRIMHGQFDFKKPDAMDYLIKVIETQCGIKSKSENETRVTQTTLPFAQKQSVKVGLYFQTDDMGNKTEYEKAMKLVKDSDIDILVFPEFSYFPFVSEMRNSDFLSKQEADLLHKKTIELSKEIGRAVVIC